MESLGNRTQRRQYARAQAKLAKLGNVASTVRTILYTSGGKHKKGQVRETVLEQAALPLVPQKDKKNRWLRMWLANGLKLQRTAVRGRVTAIVTGPIRNRKVA